MGGGKSVGKFGDSENLPAEIGGGGNILPDLVTVRKSASRNWGVNLSADLLTQKICLQKLGGICWQIHQICQSVNLQADSPNLPVSKSVSRFSDCHQICQSVNLLADSPNLPGGKSAIRNTWVFLPVFNNFFS